MFGKGGGDGRVLGRINCGRRVERPAAVATTAEGVTMSDSKEALLPAEGVGSMVVG